MLIALDIILFESKAAFNPRTVVICMVALMISRSTVFLAQNVKQRIQRYVIAQRLYPDHDILRWVQYQEYLDERSSEVALTQRIRYVEKTVVCFFFIGAMDLAFKLDIVGGIFLVLTLGTCAMMALMLLSI
jgi:ABC-type antimicrobial peptide transport system ATPase subunit